MGSFDIEVFLLKLICKFTFYADIKTIENYICNISEQAMRVTRLDFEVAKCDYKIKQI